MQDFYEAVAEFNEKRDDWGKSPTYLKDLLLNTVEETGELWHIIKWVNDEDKLHNQLEDHDEEVKDYVGDQLYILFKLCWMTGVDPEEALKNTLQENRERFPVEEMDDVNHGNPNADGMDKKRS